MIPEGNKRAIAAIGIGVALLLLFFLIFSGNG